jgi:hypothetical protein
LYLLRTPILEAATTANGWLKELLARRAYYNNDDFVFIFLIINLLLSKAFINYSKKNIKQASKSILSYIEIL